MSRRGLQAVLLGMALLSGASSTLVHQLGATRTPAGMRCGCPVPMDCCLRGECRMNARSSGLPAWAACPGLHRDDSDSPKTELPSDFPRRVGVVPPVEAGRVAFDGPGLRRVHRAPPSTPPPRFLS